MSKQSPSLPESKHDLIPPGKLVPEKRGKPVDPELKLPLQPLSQNRFTITPAPKTVVNPVDEKALKQLLQYVVEGEQDMAETLIKKNNDLLLYTETVTDLSGREFKTTAFQYALWAMDWHMWAMIQKYLPEEIQAKQLWTLETKGTAHGNHFSLKELIDALQTYAIKIGKEWESDDEQAKNHWCKVVGEAQKRLPVHVVNEYCRNDRSFKPCPTEWESKLPRTRILDVYDSTQSKWVQGSWFTSPSTKDGLGSTYAFYRYDYLWAHAEEVVWHGLELGLCSWNAVAGDFKALQSLWKTRTQQLELLVRQLSAPSLVAGSGTDHIHI